MTKFTVYNSKFNTAACSAARCRMRIACGLHNKHTKFNIKTGTFGQPELFDPQLMQLIFDPGVGN